MIFKVRILDTISVYKTDVCDIWELIQTPTSSHGVWRLLGKGLYICSTAGAGTDAPDELKVVEIQGGGVPMRGFTAIVGPRGISV